MLRKLNKLFIFSTVFTLSNNPFKNSEVVQFSHMGYTSLKTAKKKYYTYFNNLLKEYFFIKTFSLKTNHSYFQRRRNAKTSLNGENCCDPGTAAHAWEHDICDCHSQLADWGSRGQLHRRNRGLEVILTTTALSDTSKSEMDSAKKLMLVASERPIFKYTLMLAVLVKMPMAPTQRVRKKALIILMIL